MNTRNAFAVGTLLVGALASIATSPPPSYGWYAEEQGAFSLNTSLESIPFQVVTRDLPEHDVYAWATVTVEWQPASGTEWAGVVVELVRIGEPQLPVPTEGLLLVAPSTTATAEVDVDPAHCAEAECRNQYELRIARADAFPGTLAVSWTLQASAGDEEDEPEQGSIELVLE